MRVGFDLRFAHLLGGGHVYACKLLRTLVRQRPEVSWTLYYNPWSGPQREILAQLPHASRHGSHSYPWRLRPVRSGCLSLTQHAEFFACRDEADLYHYLHFDMPVGMRGTRLVLTIHDLYPLTLPGYCSGWKRSYFYHLTRHNVQRAARVITISQHTRKDILEWFQVPPEKIVVIPQSQAADYRVLDDPEQLAEVRQRYQLERPFILVTGNHKPHKNLDRLVQAYARLDADLRAEYPLVLTGKITAESRRVLARVHELGLQEQVRFVGWTPDQDLPALYNLAALSVLPSCYEGFGLAPLEAMACGTPVAVSNATAIPEVVGDVGRRFDPHNVEEMAATIGRALRHDIDNPSLRAACLAQAARFSEERTAEATFAVYRAVANAT